MAEKTVEDTRGKLIAAATDLVRRNGYRATTVDEICAQAGVTKGAFFHHFASKEALVEASLHVWDKSFLTMFESAPFQAIGDPVEKLFGCVDFFIGMLSDPRMLKSCLAGTAAQEVSETCPALRDAAQACFTTSEQNFQTLIEDAARERGAAVDANSLAKLWMATVQGSLILHKASGDDASLTSNLQHFKQYLQTLLAGAAADSGAAISAH